MILCLDVGNTQIFGGVHDGEKLVFNFRTTTSINRSSDETGIFLRNVLRENNIDPSDIDKVAICSVVPQTLYSLKGASKKYFNCEPFVLQSGVKTGLKIRYKNPNEVGADRIANAIAGTNLFPNRDLVIVDFGTATTFCVVSSNKEYLGGAILPGLKLSMNSLTQNTAKLMSVEIKQPENVVGRSTAESIQAGLYFGQVGVIKEFISRITEESFAGEKPVVIGTGGFSKLFSSEKLFDYQSPDLILEGLVSA